MVLLLHTVRHQEVLEVATTVAAAEAVAVGMLDTAAALALGVVDTADLLLVDLAIEVVMAMWGLLLAVCIVFNCMKR